MTLLALTRSVPASIGRCELTHLEREPIDYARAVREHAAYDECLRRLGCRVERLPDLPDSPDSVFVEDTAVVVDTLAVIARPGAASRRGEVASAAEALAKYRPLAFIQPPGTLDGGDVLVTKVAGTFAAKVPATFQQGVVFVGISGRTNPDGARQLATHLAPHGFSVIPVSVRGCLHLKSAVTLLRAPRHEGQAALLINPDWVDREDFAGFELVDVDPTEPAAANVLLVGDKVICAEAHARTRRRIEAHGIVTLTVPAAELAKAEGGLTCGAIIFPAAS